MHVFWRRLDVFGLERLEVTHDENAIAIVSTILGMDHGGARIDYEWVLDHDWRTRHVTIGRLGAGFASVRIERRGSGWTIDGVLRGDLDGALEPDLSATPFCNTIPAFMLPAGAGAELTLDTVYIDATDLSVTRDRQRYTRKSGGVVGYLGVHSGFAADIRFDADGFVGSYPGLFERVHPQ